jgi:hypothetical protein
MDLQEAVEEGIGLEEDPPLQPTPRRRDFVQH